jgi:hypothetical protein
VRLISYALVRFKSNKEELAGTTMTRSINPKCGNINETNIIDNAAMKISGMIGCMAVSVPIASSSDTTRTNKTRSHLFDSACLNVFLLRSEFIKVIIVIFLLIS